MASTSDIRNGLTFRYNDDIYTVVGFQHVKMGRGSAFVRVKMKSLTTGKVIENSFNSSAKIDDIRVERRKFQYLYDEGATLVFMDTDTYEQININKDMIAAMDLLMEGEMVEVPQYVIREVTYTEPGVKGDTATNALKPATVNSGAEVKVPLFINIGDKIKIDTESKSYMERVKE